MSRILPFGILLMLFVSLSACKKSDDNPDIVINVDDEFYINLFEELHPNESVFQIIIESIHNQDCLNYTIDHNVSFSNQFNRIILTINDIVEPDNCIEGQGTAFKAVPIADLQQEVYVFHINLTSAIKNIGKLNVNEDSYYLEMQTDDGIVLLNSWLYKIPENTIWGYVGYEEEEEKDNAESFVTDLAGISTEIGDVHGYKQGHYGYFSILSGQIELHQDISSTLYQPFIYFYDGEKSDISDLIDDYCTSFPGLKIHFFDDRAQEITCD